MKRGNELITDQVTAEFPPRKDLDPISPSPSPASALLKVDVAGLSHRGHVRPTNEDHFFAARMERSLKTLTTNLAEKSLTDTYEETAYGFLVADGLGGMAAGEVASGTAVRRLVELVVSTPDWIMKLDEDDDRALILDRMVQRFREIDNDLRTQANENPHLRGMGTTLTVAASVGANLVIGHIGDSRAYLLRDSALHQLTRDHTVAQALIDRGTAKAQDAVVRARRHVLTAALGATGERSDPEVQSLHLRDGDQLLLCTDGLTEIVEDQIIAATLRDAFSAEAGCRALIDRALAGGGTDNITVVLAHYRFPSA